MKKIWGKMAPLVYCLVCSTPFLMSPTLGRPGSCTRSRLSPNIFRLRAKGWSSGRGAIRDPAIRDHAVNCNPRAGGQYVILQSEIMQSLQSSGRGAIRDPAIRVFSVAGRYGILQSEIVQSTVILRQGAIRDPAIRDHAVSCGLQCIRAICGPAIIDHADAVSCGLQCIRYIRGPAIIDHAVSCGLQCIRAIRGPAIRDHAVSCGLQCNRAIRGPAIRDHAVNCDPQAGGNTRSRTHSSCSQLWSSVHQDNTRSRNHRSCSQLWSSGRGAIRGPATIIMAIKQQRSSGSKARDGNVANLFFTVKHA